MYDVVQMIGSLLILAPFVGVALGRFSSGSYGYLGVNAVGSALLAAVALIGSQWGFLLLETVWALVSLYALTRKARGRPALRNG